MHEPTHILSDKLRWLILGTLVLIVGLFAFLLLLPTETSANTNSPSVRSMNTMGSMSMSDSPNAVTAGLSVAADELSGAMASTEQAIENSRRTIAANASRNSKAVVKGLHTGVTTVGHGLSTSALFMARTVSSGVGFVVDVPSTVIGFAADTALVSAVIEPAKNTPVPTIDNELTPAIAAHADLHAAETVSAKPVTQTLPQTDSAAQWPVHGNITTLFGVPHWPYQPTHTGIDITDGKPSGTTPVKPFKPGRVTYTEYSYSGLGNQVIIDHGGGITSVYGHLASIGVTVGQAVDKTTILGYQGSTGASTGTHLHLEIRQDGNAIDPRWFIDGQP